MMPSKYTAVKGPLMMYKSTDVGNGHMLKKIRLTIMLLAMMGIGFSVASRPALASDSSHATEQKGPGNPPRPTPPPGPREGGEE